MQKGRVAVLQACRSDGRLLPEGRGSVTELTPTEVESPHGGYGKVGSHVIVGLKTVRGTKRVRDHAMYWPIRRICIILRLESETYVPLPKGDVHKREELVQNVALGDLGAASVRPQDDQDIMNVMGSQCGRSEITEICEEVSEAVKGYVNQGVAEVIPGCPLQRRVTIDEHDSLVSPRMQCHLLDSCCEKLDVALDNALLKSLTASTVILATNRDKAAVSLCDFSTTTGLTRIIAQAAQLCANVEGL
ncbi:TIP49 C-terminus-domain-containing protein [Pisolithus orientalis]|uniref:TIP49 C-terminus-domain-containing protein n=1 Tax=Pisolithus orientalis TaxID=936130 RepID=UPI0022259F7B|nr:TIP49 C-terminus-domain-containing protein [Pisolithus orientalis]KAI5994087.1 TIP49 C-terminus-domain-containing protein [Pisolithus orientalis]